MIEHVKVDIRFLPAILDTDGLELRDKKFCIQKLTIYISNSGIDALISTPSWSFLRL